MNTASGFTSIAAAIALAIPMPFPAAAQSAASTTTNTPDAADAALSIQFSGIETKTGGIMIALFDSEAAFNGGRPIRALMIAADSAEVMALVEGVPPGRYAIKSFHDIDSDGKMGSNMFGIPTEPYAFSNNVAGRASWAEASFDLAAGGNTHRIEIK